MVTHSIIVLRIEIEIIPSNNRPPLNLVNP